MGQLKSIDFVGNHLPRRCGIATFTHDLHQAVASARPGLKTGVVAMSDGAVNYDYPAAVKMAVRDDVVADYVKAAEFLNHSADVVSLQHEFGIFGGPAGADIVELVSRLEVPVVTTLHTILAEPTTDQMSVMRKIIATSTRLVTMSAKGRDLLMSRYGVNADKIDVIPHGIPDVPFLEPGHAKAKLGFSGRTVILTFGLLSPSKGIETVIDAMPGIVQACPNAVYIVLGATHPNLLRDQGEAYRNSLIARAGALGIEKNVVFLNQFLDQSALLEYIAMCDVYVTPYLNEAQMTSGTLAYSFGFGKAVVSTPYWHATELLAGGLGIIVPFGDAKAIGREISGLLSNDVRRHSMRKRAYAASRTMTWAQTAKSYLLSFERAVDDHLTNDRVMPGKVGHGLSGVRAVPELRTGHLISMCDSTGLMQHAVHAIPDRSHGYCVDDNARALLLAAVLDTPGEQRLTGNLTGRFAAFVQHAWNPDTQRFRNFMSYDRRWLEDKGSEDSHGRTLWALATCSRRDSDPMRRRWASDLFKTALPTVQDFSSPRAWAFALLALNVYCPVAKTDMVAQRLRRLLADRLLACFMTNQSEHWKWFEDVLAYDNARLSQALIETGIATSTSAYTVAGLDSLNWLTNLQTASEGHFRPVGSHSFGKRRALPAAFDQQPLEAAATVSACLAAAAIDQRRDWSGAAVSALRWFFGENDLRTSLVDQASGGCMDGLHSDRPNRNMGAESVLSYLLALAEVRLHLRAGAAPESARLALAFSA